MPHHKNHEKLEKIKDAIANSNLSEEEKSNAYKIVEEWYAQDKGLEQLIADMEAVEAKIADFIRSLGIE